jgi:hypothetical protein
MSRLWRLLRGVWDEFSTDAMTGDRSVVGFVVTLLFFVGMVVVTLAIWGAGIAVAFFAVREAVRYCVAHPSDGEAIGLYLLGGAALAIAGVYAAAAVAELRGREVRKRRGNWLVAIGGVGVAALLAGVVLFVANVHVDSRDAGTTRGADFCDAHACIPSFDQGNGSIVQCADGMWSHSGGIQGACSYHGGVGY